MALLFPRMVLEIVGSSDMDGWKNQNNKRGVGKRNFKDTIILSYSSKFVLNFYSPFRRAWKQKKPENLPKIHIKLIFVIKKKQ